MYRYFTDDQDFLRRLSIFGYMLSGDTMAIHRQASSKPAFKALICRDY